MLEGKRLRKLSVATHALWPFIFGMSSDKFARLEVDGEIITAKLLHLRELLTTESAEQVIQQYVDHDLAFGYEHKGTQWVAFDLHHQRNFLTVEDKAAPVPPEPAYTDWIKKLHGDSWESFHPDNVVPDEVRRQKAEAGRKGAAAKWQGKTVIDSTLPDFPGFDGTAMAEHGTVPSAVSEPATGVGVVTGVGETATTTPYSTVRDGAVVVADKSRKPEKPTETLETTEQTERLTQSAVDLERIWSNYSLPVSSNDQSNFQMLLRSMEYITEEDVFGVILWMIYVNKDKKTGKPYWLPQIHSTAAFVRRFRKMHEQYEKCGGIKVARVAERLTLEKQDALEKYIVAGKDFPDEGDTFKVEDVDDADGLS